MNKFRRQMRDILADVKEQALAYEESKAPYDLLFKILKTKKFPWYIFWKAGRGCMQSPGDHEYRIIRNTTNVSEPDYLSNLRPGLQVCFPNKDGKVESRIIKKCDECRQIKDDVQSERCGEIVGSLDCFHEMSVCRACTTKGTCSTCGRVFCIILAHKYSLVACSEPDCTNLMCYKYTDRDPAFDGDTTICSYKNPGNDKHYCLLHKPTGAVPAPSFDPYILELVRSSKK